MSGRLICITGAAGFLGSHLAEALARTDRVVAVDLLEPEAAVNLRGLGSGIERLKLDIGGPEFADLIGSRGFDLIFHLAGNAYVPPSVEDPVRDFEANPGVTVRLLEAMRGTGSGARLVFASTAAVYGTPELAPTPETAPTEPVSPYGAGKLAAEAYVGVYARVFGLRTAVIRFFSMFGPRLRRQIVFDFMEKLSRDPERLEIIGDGGQVRDLLYVDDAVGALSCVAQNAGFGGEVYNAGSGRSCSTLELARVLSRVMGLEPEFEFTGELRPGDAQRWEADITRLRALGWAPERSLESALKETVDWYRGLSDQ